MLNRIIEEYIIDFNAKRNDPALKDVIVKNSIPVIWFGAVNAYMNSEKRIITVGLNPSNAEFPEDYPQKRFDSIDFEEPVDSTMIERLKCTLNSYFEKEPYRRWFGSGEKVLSCFDASYYSGTGKRNQAIHIDIYSAIATNPTWGKLGKNIKTSIQNFELFKKLLVFLNPDVILVSTNKDVFNEVFVKSLMFEHNENDERTENKSYVRKFYKNEKTLYWITNIRGTAFGPRKEFIENSIKILTGDN